jgi:hypothetical protein
LGIEVQQQDGLITLRQTGYAKKLLEKGGMSDCNPCVVPMEARLKLSKVGEGELIDATFYRSLVGSLRYLVHTRPDIAFAVSYVSRFMETPTTQHLAAVKHLLRYIAGTLEFGVSYGRGHGAPKLLGYSDADWAGDVDDRKSMTRLIFFLGHSPISWQSQKQRGVAGSTCEAEYMVGATAACQGVWLSRLLGELQNEEPQAPRLLMDNKSAISLSKNTMFHERTKHIDTRYHMIRYYVEEGDLEIEYINTEAQLADLLMKALGRVRFQGLRSRFGVAEIK